MKIKVVFITLLVVFLLSAFASQPAPSYALPLPEGRTLDEGHDSGFIDWSGPVAYTDFNHRDSICPTGCVEPVTYIDDGGSVSGSFAATDVLYFEVGVALTHDSSTGDMTLSACSSSTTRNLYLGPGAGLPGFVSVSLSVPSGCTSWSLSASGGYVVFRSVNANYASPPTETFTLTPTETSTPTPTDTATSTPTDTATPTATETPTETSTPVVIPSDTSAPRSSGGGHIVNPPVIPFLPFSTATQVPAVAQIPPTIQTHPTSLIVSTGTSKASTPAPVSTSTPALIPLLPTDIAACTKTNSDFPWWLIPGGMTIALALSSLNSLLRDLDTASITLGDLSISPFGVTIPVPHRVQRKTTVGEWITRPIRKLVQITRTIWKTITEAVPRFINRVRQVIDKIVHSEWVTTFRQVAKTFYEKVTEKVPLLGWFGQILGFIWKTFIKPVIRWITEAIRTLRTWIENVVRWVVERIQDGWNYITRQISETIREWVEKTEWVREWLTKEITVWETVWEKKFYPFAIGGGGGKLAIPALQTWSLLLRRAGLTTTLATAAVALGCCIPFLCTPTPTATATIPPAILTQAWETAVAALTQAPIVASPPPMPTATAIPFQFPADKVFIANNQIFTCNDVALYFGVSLDALLNANPGLNCSAVNIGITKFNIPPLTLKSPSEYVSQYHCVPPKGEICLPPNATVEEMITYTLFNEGGSSEGNQFSADVMQVILNRANKILNNWGIDTSQLSREDYARLVLHVIAHPADSNASVAAFEAFSSPCAPPTSFTQPNWDAAVQIAQTVLDNKGQNWASGNQLLSEGIRDNPDVLFYCSVKKNSGNPPLGSTAQIPLPGQDSLSGTYTYFFSSYQYDPSVAEWCKANR